jgi:hypothetical protein
MCKRPVIINIINAKKCDLAMQKKVYFTQIFIYIFPHMIDQNKIKFYYKINVISFVTSKMVPGLRRAIEKTNEFKNNFLII